MYAALRAIQKCAHVYVNPNDFSRKSSIILQSSVTDINETLLRNYLLIHLANLNNTELSTTFEKWILKGLKILYNV